MKKKILNRLVASVLVCGSILAVGTNANAEIKTENGIVIGKDGEQTSKVRFKYGVSGNGENGRLYYVDASGRETGWVNEDGKIYYYNDKREMQKNTVIKDINGNEVKLNNNGVAVGEHGYELIDGEEVTYDSSEAYKKSHKCWKMVDDDWHYYLYDCKDCMVSDSWQQDNGVWYYFDHDGKMQKNTTVKDGQGNDCVLNADGALTNRNKPEKHTAKAIHADNYSWKQIGGNWYYMNSNGDKKNGWIQNEETGKWYYCNQEGVMQKNTTIIDHDIKYILGSDGAWIH